MILANSIMIVVNLQFTLYVVFVIKIFNILITDVIIIKSSKTETQASTQQPVDFFLETLNFFEETFELAQLVFRIF